MMIEEASPVSCKKTVLVFFRQQLKNASGPVRTLFLKYILKMNQAQLQ